MEEARPHDLGRDPQQPRGRRAPGRGVARRRPGGARRGPPAAAVRARALLRRPGRRRPPSTRDRDPPLPRARPRAARDARPWCAGSCTTTGSRSPSWTPSATTSSSSALHPRPTPTAAPWSAWAAAQPIADGTVLVGVGDVPAADLEEAWVDYYVWAHEPVGELRPRADIATASSGLSAALDHAVSTLVLRGGRIVALSLVFNDLAEDGITRRPGGDATDRRARRRPAGRQRRWPAPCPSSARAGCGSPSSRGAPSIRTSPPWSPASHPTRATR